MHRRSVVAVAATSIALVGAVVVAANASAAQAGKHRGQHVLLISVDGMHQSDLDWYIAHHPSSTLTRS